MSSNLLRNSREVSATNQAGQRKFQGHSQGQQAFSATHFRRRLGSYVATINYLMQLKAITARFIMHVYKYYPQSHKWRYV